MYMRLLRAVGKIVQAVLAVEMPDQIGSNQTRSDQRVSAATVTTGRPEVASRDRDEQGDGAAGRAAAAENRDEGCMSVGGGAGAVSVVRDELICEAVPAWLRRACQVIDGSAVA